MSARLAERLYRAALRLLPRGLRGEYGDEAAALFAWQLSRLDGRARIRFVAGSLADVVRQSVAGRGRRGIWQSDRKESRMESVVHDLRVALRNLVRQPGLTVPVVGALGLGIGLATAMVAVVQGVLLRPLPYPDDDRLVVLRERTESGGLQPASVLNFNDWRAGAASFEEMAGVFGPQQATVLGGEEPVRVPVLFVTADFFRVAGDPPALGRSFAAEENREGGPPAVVVSDRFWQRTLASRDDLETARLRIQDLLGRIETYTVVGVMPAGFDLMGQADVYVPLDRAVPWNVRGNHVLSVVGRLIPSASRDGAAAELDGIQSRIRAEHSGETEAVGVGVQSLRDEVVGPVHTPVVLLLVGALLLLASAFVDVAGALLARGVARRQELLVRVSLGATRRRLLQQLVLESGLYAAGGFFVSVVVARVLLDGLMRLAPTAIPRLSSLEPAWLGLAATAALLAGVGTVLFGGLTALITIRRGVAPLRIRGGGAGRGARRVWNALIAAEVALALMLLTTAGVLGRSLWGIISEDTGFLSDGVITAEVSLTADDGYESFVAFFDRALVELRALPGVASAGLSNMLPGVATGGIGSPVRLESGERPDVFVQYRVADGGFFETLGIAVRRGRAFNTTDVPGAPHAAVINTTMAERLWPAEDPIGRRFHLDGMDPYDAWLTVVGVVEEARPWSVAPGTYPVFYVDYRQRPTFLTFTGADFVVRGSASSSLADGIRSRLGVLDPEVPVRVGTLEARLASRTADRRFVLALLGIFAVLALGLTAVGIWGVVSFIAARRTRDTSIRLALGANPGQVVRGLQREALPSVVVGIFAGGVLAVLLTRFMRSMLFGVGVFDPVSLVVVAIAVAITAWLASYIPARRVKRLDPAVTLRDA